MQVHLFFLSSAEQLLDSSPYFTLAAVFACSIRRPHNCPYCLTGSAGQNKQHLVSKNTAKLDRETEELHHDRIPLEVGKVIQKGRQDKGLTQKDLATVSRRPVDCAVDDVEGFCCQKRFVFQHFQKVNEKPQVIADYECGKAIPNNQIMGKIERVLGKKGGGVPHQSNCLCYQCCVCNGDVWFEQA